tara:strand:+ start:898 stop:1152 length:255 start_codon:yes stop_codon:yes gene_type:complete
MNWLIVVFFVGVYSDGTQDSYIFEKPAFETKDACINAATDKEQINEFVRQLVIDVGHRDIQKVVCATEEKIRTAIELTHGGENT